MFTVVPSSLVIGPILKFVPRIRKEAEGEITEQVQEELRKNSTCTVQEAKRYIERLLWSTRRSFCLVVSSSGNFIDRNAGLS